MDDAEVEAEAKVLEEPSLIVDESPVVDDSPPVLAVTDSGTQERPKQMEPFVVYV